MAQYPLSGLSGAETRAINRAEELLYRGMPRAEAKPYEPTTKERLSGGLQSGLQRIGMSPAGAKRGAEGVFGGESTAGIGLMDLAAMANPIVAAATAPLYAEEGMRNIRRGVSGINELTGSVFPEGRPESKLDYLEPAADILGGMFDVAPVIAGATAFPRKIATRLARREPMAAAPMPRVTESRYDTKQEAPFYRVNPRKAAAGRPSARGVREEAGQAGTVGGSAGSNVPQPISDEALRDLIDDPGNFVRRAADDYTQRLFDKPYERPTMPVSSLAKQSSIGRAFELAAEDSPAYRQRVFEAYGERYPELVEATGAQNYDQLLEAAYQQLAKETADQFHTLPINMSYHRAGEGNYIDSGEMLRDVYGNRHMYVYQGGDPHQFLNVVDPETGLNTNEMFRAVHDFYGHAVHGNPFGPKGEEVAYGAHSRMFSPLARLAMAAETRGQNSFVNYTPVNAQLRERINRVNAAIFEAKRRGDDAEVALLQPVLKELWADFQFAPQKSVLLPPEMLDLGYGGQMPEYVRGVLRPAGAEELLTHFSTAPGLSQIDPRRYGTGIRGEEAVRLRSTQNPVLNRAYFYTGDPAQIQKEVGLGPHRYGTMGSGLYDIEADPLNFRTLATEANRYPYGPVNPGMVPRGQVETDIERMAREYGYTGALSPSRGAAIMFDPVPVQPFSKGGRASSKAKEMLQAYMKPKEGTTAAQARSALERAAESAGVSKPAVAGELTGLQDFHTSLGDRIRARVLEQEELMKGFDYKYDKGQRVFTKDSAAKNRPPYTIIHRTTVGNTPMREDSPLGPGMGKFIKDPVTGKTMRAPYEPGYKVRQEIGDEWQEFNIPQSAIIGDVEMKRGGKVKR